MNHLLFDLPSAKWECSYYHLHFIMVFNILKQSEIYFKELYTQVYMNKTTTQLTQHKELHKTEFHEKDEHLTQLMQKI